MSYIAFLEIKAPNKKNDINYPFTGADMAEIVRKLEQYVSELRRQVNSELLSYRKK